MRSSEIKSPEALSSVLTLACAATALTGSQAAGAIVVDNSLSGMTVGFSAESSLSWNLPGGSTLRLFTENPVNSYFEIVAGITGPGAALGRQNDNRSMVDQGGVGVAFRTGPNSAVTWNNNGGARSAGVAAANVIRSHFYYGFEQFTYVRGKTYRRYFKHTSTYGGTYSTSKTYTSPGYSMPIGYVPPTGEVTGPGSFTSKFLLFTFSDGGTTKYGWAEMLAGTIVTGNPGSMGVTLGRLAYETSGDPIGAGMAPIPEPASTAAVLGGAMVLGAAGIRRWRRERAGSN